MFINQTICSINGFSGAAAGQVFEEDGIEVVGNYHTVKGKNCIIRGNYNKVYGDDCQVFGNYNEVSGQRCKITGNYNRVSGNHCKIDGNYNQISGKRCICKGNYNTPGDNSTPSPRFDQMSVNISGSHIVNSSIGNNVVIGNIQNVGTLFGDNYGDINVISGGGHSCVMNGNVLTLRFGDKQLSIDNVPACQTMQTFNGRSDIRAGRDTLVVFDGQVSFNGKIVNPDLLWKGKKFTHVTWEFLRNPTAPPFEPVFFGEKKFKITPDPDTIESRTGTTITWRKGDMKLIARPNHTVQLCFNDTEVSLDWLFEDCVSVEMTFDYFVDKFLKHHAKKHAEN